MCFDNDSSVDSNRDSLDSNRESADQNDYPDEHSDYSSLDSPRAKPTETPNSAWLDSVLRKARNGATMTKTIGEQLERMQGSDSSMEYECPSNDELF